jgi:hypothetical protein
MVEDTDRRSTPRIDLECPIIFSRFNSRNKHAAVAKNYTQFGMYFESEKHFLTGAHLIIRRQPCSGPYDCVICDRITSILFAEVRWSEELHRSGAGAYGMGVKCLIPY